MALKPIFARFDYVADRWIWGLGPEDFRKVQEGYACDRCLEEWTTWIPSCPVCGESNLPKFDEPRPEWKR